MTSLRDYNPGCAACRANWRTEQKQSLKMAFDWGFALAVMVLIGLAARYL